LIRGWKPLLRPGEYLQLVQTTQHKILIIGGYGTFGGRIARLLADESRLELLIAGRTLQKARSFISRYANHATMLPVEFDRDGDVERQIAAISPAIVIDASGPFQAYGEDAYRVVSASISCGAHYLDIADSAEFVSGIDEFNTLAKDSQVFALSGASTCVALSSTIFRRLAQDLDRVVALSGGIAPSPHAGVGYSVIQAVAHSAGKPIKSLQGNKIVGVYPFTDSRPFTIAPPGQTPLRRRTFSLADVPDLRLAKIIEPKAESIWFGAAPAPGIYHALLRVLAQAVRRGWLRSLAPVAPLMSVVMQNLVWGEHRGGMWVEVRGEKKNGSAVTRSWHLLAAGDDGPSIPSTAIAAIVRNYLQGRTPSAGARPAVGELEFGDFEVFFRALNIHTGFREENSDERRPVFRTVLGDAWQQLPAAIRALHESNGIGRFSGRASVMRGKSLVAKLIGRVIGFPPDGGDVPVNVTMNSTTDSEYWTRDFAGHEFSSVMTPGDGRFSHLVCERFGPVTFAMALVLDNGRLNYVQRGWTFLGMPMPRFLGPRGKTCEFVEDGKFHFHVEIELPLIGHIVTYDGWLAETGSNNS